MQPLATKPAGTQTDGFLEHSPSRRSLYYKGPALPKIISEFFGVPPHNQKTHSLGSEMGSEMSMGLSPLSYSESYKLELNVPQ